MPDACAFPNCERKHYAYGLCNAHNKQRQRGETLRTLRQDISLQDRFESKINYNGPINPKTGTSCHIWTDAPARKYGQIKIDGKSIQAHRLAWELYVGPIPDGHEIDHDDDLIGCHNKMCVNVEHLQPTLTNQRRRKNNTSGFWGICWDKTFSRWKVRICGKTPAIIGLPASYNSAPPPAKPPIEAVEARDKLRAHLGLPE